MGSESEVRVPPTLPPPSAALKHIPGSSAGLCHTLCQYSPASDAHSTLHDVVPPVRLHLDHLPHGEDEALECDVVSGIFDDDDDFFYRSLYVSQYLIRWKGGGVVGRTHLAKLFSDSLHSAGDVLVEVGVSGLEDRRVVDLAAHE